MDERVLSLNRDPFSRLLSKSFFFTLSREMCQSKTRDFFYLEHGIVHKVSSGVTNATPVLSKSLPFRKVMFCVIREKINRHVS